MAIDRHQPVETHVIQDFDTQDGALAAIRALQEAGFANDSISVIARDESVAHDITTDSGAGETEAGESAVTGMTTGGVVGAISALLIGATTLAIPGLGIAVGAPLVGALAGAAGGGLLGGLIGLGIPDDEAQYYSERAGEGRILLVVAANGRAGEAGDIMATATLEEDTDAGIYDDSHDSTGNTILDQGIISHTMGITPPVDTTVGQDSGEGNTAIDDDAGADTLRRT